MDYWILSMLAFAGITFASTARYIWVYGKGSKLALGIVGPFLYGIFATSLAAFCTAAWWYGVIKEAGGLATLQQPFFFNHVLPLAAVIWVVQQLLVYVLWRSVSHLFSNKS